MNRKESTMHTPQRLHALGAALVLLALGGCGSLHDERYHWCQADSCAIAQVVTPAAEPPAVVRPPPTPVPATRRVTLSADALFAFDRSGAQDILPQGKAELDALARALRSQDVQAQRLTLTGHTDRLGSEAYNQALSQRRAGTVAAYLKAQGVDVPMEIRAVGEREPVTRDCQGTDRTPALVACLQPDRRVVVDILGQAR
jgi:outer membrane protein OmpA-like peptidoglycan-associated protein